MFGRETEWSRKDKPNPTILPPAQARGFNYLLNFFLVTKPAVRKPKPIKAR